MQRKPNKNTIMATTQLNDMQWRLVRMFSFIKTKQQEAELRKVVWISTIRKSKQGLTNCGKKAS